MIINFSPVRREGTLKVKKKGDILTINDVVYDFIDFPDGASLPSSAVDCEYITGDIQRIDGVLNITLILPHGPNPSNAVAFPAPLVDPKDGAISIPK